jgi:type IV pilus assembly protein PilV
MSLNHHRPSRRRVQGGIALLEALIAILVFSIGVLGVVGLQARSVQGLSEAGLRSQAVQHANELIAEMWLTDPGLRANLYNSAGAGSRYTYWLSRVTSGSRLLPGADANPPIVVVNTVQQPLVVSPGESFSYSDVTITIRWLPPGAVAGTPASQYVTTTRILEPQS